MTDPVYSDIQADMKRLDNELSSIYDYADEQECHPHLLTLLASMAQTADTIIQWIETKDDR